MPSRRRSLWVALLVPLAAYGACRALHRAPAASADPSLLFDRVWIERMPESKTDYVHVFFVLEDPKRGIFDRGSSYDVHFEVFEYRREDNRLALVFPQTGKKATVTAKVTECKDEKPFDLCLDLSQNPWPGGPKRYRAILDDDEAARVLGDAGAKARAAARAR